MIAGAAMGIGAMTSAMLGLPLTAVLLVTVLLPADGLALTPLVIVAVAVSYVTSARLAPALAWAATVPPDQRRANGEPSGSTSRAVP